MPVADLPFAVDDKRRLRRSGDRTFAYDEAGRLSEFAHPTDATRYRYDGDGRLIEVVAGARRTRLHYADQIVPTRVDEEEIRYDALGRRTSCGETRYRYNMYGQLTEVMLADGATILILLRRLRPAGEPRLRRRARLLRGRFRRPPRRRSRCAGTRAAHLSVAGRRLRRSRRRRDRRQARAKLSSRRVERAGGDRRA